MVVSAPRQLLRCPSPGCRAPVQPGATVCWQCGEEIDLRTRVEREPEAIALQFLLAAVAVKAVFLLMAWATGDWQLGFFLVYAGVLAAGVLTARRVLPPGASIAGAVGLSRGVPPRLLPAAGLALAGALTACLALGQIGDLVGVEAAGHWRDQLLGALFNRETTGRAWFGFFVGVLFGAFCEEFAFRAVAQKLVAVRHSPHLAVWLTAAVWAAFQADPLLLLPFTVAGAALGYLAHYTGSVWAPAVGHFLLFLFWYRLGGGGNYLHPLGAATSFGRAVVLAIVGAGLLAAGVAWLAARSAEHQAEA
ncbi:MAG: CPBP family intramembrane metalloprotease [Planctomycetes bacterium]|nr:CPBP family intramembrane metalloprotease [Planctomycetota bacterium]